MILQILKNDLVGFLLFKTKVIGTHVAAAAIDDAAADYIN
jgi:hypothetical protein